MFTKVHFYELKTTLDADAVLKSSVKTFFTEIHLSELEITLYQDGSFQSGFKMTSSMEIHSFEVVIISPAIIGVTIFRMIEENKRSIDYSLPKRKRHAQC